MKHLKLFENINNQNFIVDDDKFELYLDDILVAESYFCVEEPDDLFNEKYIGLYKLKTNENFRGKGYMKYLLKQIFDYVKNELNIFF